MNPRIKPWIPVIGWLLVLHDGMFNFVPEEQVWKNAFEYWSSAVFQVLTFIGFMLGVVYLTFGKV